MKRILITVPDLNEPGGVANYYSALALDAEEDIEYFEVTGARGVFGRLARLTLVYGRLLLKLPKIDTVLINPSLTRNSFWRDAIIVLLARLLSDRVVVFWRGWHWPFYERIKHSLLHRFVMTHTFGKVHETVYLARLFAEALAPFADSGQIRHFETTVADDRYLDKSIDRSEKQDINLLFMSRMDREKGVFVVLDVYRELKPRYSQLTLTMAGVGADFEAARNYAAEHAMTDVKFPGYIRDSEKHKALSAADIFVFPTTYGEGMPNCVLEARAYGIPVVSRNNAGIPDVVTDGVEGFLTDAEDAETFTLLVDKLVADAGLRQRMGAAAREGSERFGRLAVRERLLSLLRRN